MDNYDENPFWGEPTPTDLWEDMKKLNALYDKPVSYTHLTLPTMRTV